MPVTLHPSPALRPSIATRLTGRTERPGLWCRGWTVPLLALVFACVALGGTTLRPGVIEAQAPPHSTAQAGRVELSTESGLEPDAQALAETFRPTILEAETRFGALFGVQPDTTLAVTFVEAPDPALTSQMTPVDDLAWIGPDDRRAIVAHAAFVALSPVEAANVLTNLESRLYLEGASGRALPAGLVDGIARYVEAPVTAREARLGSLVQGRYQAGTLPGLGDIIAGRTGDLTPEEATAVRYALVSFIADRYGVASLRDLVTSFSTERDWTVSFGTVLLQSVGQFDQAWVAYLPRWFASGWRTNAVAHFDLGPAQSLFDRGAYEAASASAQKSQQLFSDLDDQPRLAAAESLIAQCAVGQQADSTMREVEIALNDRDYGRADALLDDADQFYTQLPETHRPASLLTAYRDIANRGLEAERRLDEGQAGLGEVFNLKDARANAVSAAQTYAEIGDSDGLIAADATVDRIDARIRRYVLVFGALSVVVATWSGVWIWNRAPGSLRWNSRPVEQPQ